MSLRSRRRARRAKAAKRRKEARQRALNHIMHCTRPKLREFDDSPDAQKMLTWELGPRSAGMITNWKCPKCLIRYEYFAEDRSVAFRGLGRIPIDATILDVLAVYTA